VVRSQDVVSQGFLGHVHAAAIGLLTGSGPAPLGGWWLVIGIIAASAVLLAVGLRLRRRRWRRISVAVGGVGCLAAASCAGVLAVAAPAAATGPVRAAWGVAQVVSPTVKSSATTWPVDDVNADLMMPTVAPDGSVWIGEMAANRLARLMPSQHIVQQVALPGGYKEVMGLAVDGHGQVWLAEEHAQAIGLFDPSTGHYHQYRIPAADPAPVGIAVDAHGDVWFTEMSGDRIGRFDPRTGRFTQFAVPTPEALPYWLAIAPDGKVWFTEFGTGKVGVLQPSTGRISQYRLPAGQIPSGIAIGPGGTPWLATLSGSLFRVEPASGSLRQFQAPAANIYGVAVTANKTVWLGSASGDAVYAFDPANATFRSYALPRQQLAGGPGCGIAGASGYEPWWVAPAGNNRVWVALGATNVGALGEVTESR
jgi:virginiamycin B lyase